MNGIHPTFDYVENLKRFPSNNIPGGTYPPDRGLTGQKFTVGLDPLQARRHVWVAMHAIQDVSGRALAGPAGADTIYSKVSTGTPGYEANRWILKANLEFSIVGRPCGKMSLTNSADGFEFFGISAPNDQIPICWKPGASPQPRMTLRGMTSGLNAYCGHGADISPFTFLTAADQVSMLITYHYDSIGGASFIASNHYLAGLAVLSEYPV